jgi:hypothetical protein
LRDVRAGVVVEPSGIVPQNAVLYACETGSRGHNARAPERIGKRMWANSAAYADYLCAPRVRTTNGRQVMCEAGFVTSVIAG